MAVQPGSNWTVYGSNDGFTGFFPIAGLTNQTADLTSISLLPVFNNYLFAAGDAPGASVLLNQLQVVPLPGALVLFGTGLAGLGFVGRRRKRVSALAAL